MMLDIFVEAALKMESPLGFSTRNRRPWTGYYSGIGLAKVSDAEMEGRRGDVVSDKHEKVGLGLRPFPCDDACVLAMDQADPNVAYIAMKTRIELRLNECVKKNCTSTDMVMVALLAADERITPKKIRTEWGMYSVDDNEQIKLNWEIFLDKNWTGFRNKIKNKQLINRFSNNVQNLQPQDFPEIDWEYIKGLGRWHLSDF